MADHAESIVSNSSTLSVITVIGGFLVPVLFPLVMWLAQRNQNKTVEETGKEVLNFQLSFIALSIGTMIGLLILSAIGAFLATWIAALFGVVLMGLAYITLGITYLVLMV